MARLGSSLTSRGRITAVDEHLARIRAVTRDDVVRVLHRVLAAPSVLSVVGPFDEDDRRLAASMPAPRPRRLTVRTTAADRADPPDTRRPPRVAH